MDRRKDRDQRGPVTRGARVLGGGSAQRDCVCGHDRREYACVGGDVARQCVVRTGIAREVDAAGDGEQHSDD
eukprot:5784722-Pleurochrysis_carterae.AAC.2